MLKHITIATSILCLSACSAHVKLPIDGYGDEPRASFSSEFMTSKAAKLSGEEETTPLIRDTALEAIRRQLLQDGFYPKSAVEKTMLASLVAIPPNKTTGPTRWSYRALVRINLNHYSVEHHFLIFERNDEIIARKISI